jgi:hypothetical protein
MAKKKQLTRSELKSLRAQQILFIIISLMIIFAMVMSLVSNL